MQPSDTSFSVFVSDDVSYCVENTMLDRIRWHVDVGHALFWDAAPSQVAGWARAATELGKLPQDYDDKLLPIACFEPRRLYRSVSFPELAAILEEGVINGGGNQFNEWEHRPFVFFSPSLSETCIHQGSDVERTAAYLAGRTTNWAVYPNRDDWQRAFRSTFRHTFSDLKAKLESLPHTHAVLETAPVGPSLHYSTEHGRTGMGGEDEYGLFPGQVRAEDIVAVHWARGLIIQEVTPLEGAAERLTEYGFASMNQEKAIRL